MRLHLPILAARVCLSLLLIVLLHLPPQLAFGQVLEPPGLGALEGDLVDRVVAVVGDSAIFYSQVQEQVLRLQASGMPIPDNPSEVSALERNLLDELVNQMLVLTAAVQDTLLTVSDARVDQEAEQAWEDAVSRFGSEATVAQGLESEGLTIAQYRASQREEIRKGLLMESYILSQREESRLIPVEEREIREFFGREQGNLEDRPETLTFDQVVLAPQPSDSVRAVAREEASNILSLLDDGGDFEDLARRFSHDPGSAPLGGELGWVRLGTMVEEFEAATFLLGRGEVSDLVDTQFGTHIILVERIRGAERMVRHILITADPTEADIEVTRERAAQIRDEIASGVRISDFYDEGEETGIPNPMIMPRDQLGQLPSGLAQAIGTAEEGAVLGPIEIQAQPGEPQFAVVHVQEIREAGQLTYEDVRGQIRELLQDEKFQEQLTERLRSQSYVEVRW